MWNINVFETEENVKGFCWEEAGIMYILYNTKYIKTGQFYKSIYLAV